MRAPALAPLLLRPWGCGALMCHGPGAWRPWAGSKTGQFMLLALLGFRECLREGNNGGQATYPSGPQRAASQDSCLCPSEPVEDWGWETEGETASCLCPGHLGDGQRHREECQPLGWDLPGARRVPHWLGHCCFLHCLRPCPPGPSPGTTGPGHFWQASWDPQLEQPVQPTGSAVPKACDHSEIKVCFVRKSIPGEAKGENSSGTELGKEYT